MRTKLNVFPVGPKSDKCARVKETVSNKQFKSKEYTDKRRGAKYHTFKPGDQAQPCSCRLLSLTHSLTLGNLRIVLLGKTGSGKSATGNTILGRNAFIEEFNPESVTRACEAKNTIKGSRTVTVIDTPGLFDTWMGEKKDMTEEKLKAKIEKCLEMSAPGPHVFLLVIRLDQRYTDEEKNTVKWVQRNFGEEASRYVFTLFTHADYLKNKTLKDHIEENEDLRQFVISCAGKYYSLENENRENQSQVVELLEKIDKMVERNAGKYYTRSVYTHVQRKLNLEKRTNFLYNHNFDVPWEQASQRPPDSSFLRQQ
ncbi:GTPase IMAP family member 9-like [Carassius gibelio]|uniref:GTPase IMAP family member 9-like n=1 Tax=Carassius gibelio TaxID=101364 RepID=UPI002278A1B5|nr:GTPase IMAP family member 9-like [Carassius gibelio]